MSLIDSLGAAASSKLSKLTGGVKSSVTPNLDKFKTVGTGAQNVNQYMYPSELTTDPDLQHWVTFNINVRGKSKIAKEQNLAATQAPVSIKGENRLDPSKMDNAIAGKTAVSGTIAGLGIGKSLGNKFGLGRTLGKALYQRAGKGISGGAAGLAGTAVGAGLVGLGAAALTELVVQPDTTYRISDSISLHVSQAPVSHYGADYGTVEMGAVAGFFGGGSSIADSAKGLIDAGPEILRALGQAAMSAPAGLTAGGARIDVAQKQSLNPYREVLFKQIAFRKFAFDYRFYPQSQAETDQIQKIIKTFKYHMHPELSAKGLYYIHPSEFNITYYYKGKENPYFNKISTCVLTDMSVRYGDESQFSSFKDGAPVEINLHLEFQELETLTKERIDQGY